MHKLINGERVEVQSDGTVVSTRQKGLTNTAKKNADASGNKNQGKAQANSKKQGNK